jgi:hypothetical protein
MLGGGGSSNNLPNQGKSQTTEDTSQAIKNDLDDEIPF